jgi:VanZ family protein
LYAVFIVYGGTIPFHFSGDSSAILERAHHVPLNPFVSADTGGRLSVPDTVQNVLLFLPFGALGMLGAAKGRQFRRLIVVTALALLLSTSVEALQLFTPDRVSSVADLWTNTLGAFIGGLTAWWGRSAVVAFIGKLRSAGLDTQELRPVLIAAVVMAVAFWQPFDVTLEVGTVVGKVRGLQSDLWQFTGLRDEGTSIVISAFFAMTFASYLSVLGERQAGWRTVAIGIGFVFLMEASQTFIGSRMPGLWDALVGVSGVIVGVAIWAAAGRLISPVFWLGVLASATFVAAALQMLSPFEITPTYHTFGWFPFLGYYSHTTFETLSHVIELMLLYFPLGFWIARSAGPTFAQASTFARASTSAQASADKSAGKPAGPAGPILLILLLTLAIAGPIEYLQGWVAGRYPDASDVAVSLFGGWLGFRLALTRT